MGKQETNNLTAASAAETTPPPQPDKKTLWPEVGPASHLAVIFVLGAIVLFTYANTLHNTGFALDNKFIIIEDPRLREPTEGNLRLIFTQDYWWPKAVSGLYRPLTTLSYLVNYSMLGNRDTATGYHWISFLLHWINAVLVYLMVLVLMEKLWPALFAAAIFATHPIATESVANLVGRADLFATLAVLAGFLVYAKAATVQEEREPKRGMVIGLGVIAAACAAFVFLNGAYPTLVPESFRSGRWVLAALLVLAASTIALACSLGGWRKLPWLVALAVIATLGVFSKESAIVVLGVMGLYDVTYRLRHRRANWLANLFANFWVFATKGYIALAAPFLALWYVRSWVFEQLRPPELPWVDNPLVMPGVDFWTARMTAIKIIGKYFWLLLWPQTLSCDYSYNQVPIVSWRFNSWEDIKAVFALVAVIVVLLIAIRNYYRNKPLFFFVILFFGTFLPTSNLLRIIGSIMAERFMYMPSIGYAGCVVLAVYAICRRLIPHLDLSTWAQRIWLQVVARGVLSLIVLGYGVRAFVRNYDWEDDERLWIQAVQACPDSFKTHKSLAFALYEKDPEYKNIARIIEEGEKALAVTDKTQIVLLHLGAYYRIQGDVLAQRAPDGTLIPTAASIPWYQKSIDVLARAVPLDHEFNDDNMRKELARGRKPENIQDIGNHEIYWNLGLSCMRVGQYDNALQAYLYMRHLAPLNPDAYLSIASVYIATGHPEEALIVLLQALLIDSNRQEALRLTVELYRQLDHEGCAIVYGPGQSQPRLNSDCAIVRNHICTAYYGLIQVLLETKQYPLALQTKQGALKNYGCAPDLFNKLLPEPTPKLTLSK